MIAIKLIAGSESDATLLENCGIYPICDITKRETIKIVYH